MAFQHQGIEITVAPQSQEYGIASAAQMVATLALPAHLVHLLHLVRLVHPVRITTIMLGNWKYTFVKVTYAQGYGMKSCSYY